MDWLHLENMQNFFLKCEEKGIFGEVIRNYAKISMFGVRREVGECKEVDQYKSVGRVMIKNKPNQISVPQNREFLD
jgi:hypothetical protein